MSIFDGILGNLGGIADKLGIPPEQLQSLAETAQAKLADGGDHMSALMSAAQEHGFSLDSVQNMLGGSSVEDVLGKLGGGEGGMLGSLGDMTKGLFGKE